MCFVMMIDHILLVNLKLAYFLYLFNISNRNNCLHGLKLKEYPLILICLGCFGLSNDVKSIILPLLSLALQDDSFSGFLPQPSGQQQGE